MSPERRKSPNLELSQREQEILRAQMQDLINYAWAGPHDRKYFPTNKQISMEELKISNSMSRLRRESGSYRKRKSQDPNSTVSLIAGAVSRAEDRSNRRLKQLRSAWYEQDSRIRQETGVNWDDLWEVLAPLDIKPVDTSKLRRPHNRSIFTDQEDPFWGLSDTYSFASESTRFKKRPNSDETVEVPAHIVELFGNEVTFSEEDFNATVQRLSLKQKRVYQIEESDVDSVTYTPIFQYRVVVPYKNWLLVSKEWFYDEKPPCPKDKTQEFKYWEESLLPEVLVQPNRGIDFIDFGELLRSLPMNGPIH